MKNTNSKRTTLLTLLFFLLCTSAISQNTDKQGNITKRRYFYVYTDAQTSEAGVGYTHHLYSNTIQVVDSYGSIKTKVLSQWMDVIQVNHPDLTPANKRRKTNEVPWQNPARKKQKLLELVLLTITKIKPKANGLAVRCVKG